MSNSKNDLYNEIKKSLKIKNGGKEDQILNSSYFNQSMV